MLKPEQMDRIVSVLYNDGKLDPARIPGVVEQEIYRLLNSAGLLPQKFEEIASNTVVAARLPLDYNSCSTDSAVSAVASIVTATAVAFPKEVFVKPVGDEHPAFFSFLHATREKLDRADRAGKENQELRQRWYWGVAVGVVQILRWVNCSDYGGENCLGRSEQIEGVRGGLVTFFSGLLHNDDGVGFMEKSLIGRVSGEISKLQKEKPWLFYWLLRSVVEKTKARISPFGSQMICELRDRFWFSLDPRDQEELILHALSSLATR